MRSVSGVVALAAAVAAALLVGPQALAGGAPQPAGVAGGPAGESAVVVPVDGAVVREFDPPATPYGPGHRGVDLDAGGGDPVRAAMAGVVTFSGDVAGVRWVTVDHGGGLDTTYGEFGPLAVSAGDRVEAGQPLGRLAGSAGHLDWGARLDGEYIDPLSLLGSWRPRLVPLGD
jgi:murein DD-endopeptidase MepM/ murein hydrolase activator NlpD